MTKKLGCSWSGGKDSCFALMKTLRQENEPLVLVNMMNENGKISRSHGLPFSLLHQQAQSMNLPIIATPTSWKDYEVNFIEVLTAIRTQYGVDAMVFGDIDLQQHRDWEEKVCEKAGLEPILPLWQQDRKELILEMLDAGIETMIVSCNTAMGESFLGKVMDKEIISRLEDKGVDVCGENGEFHTLVLYCPLFEQRVEVPLFQTVLHDNYWFLQWDLMR